MKSLIIFSVIAFFFAGNSGSQTQSDLTYDAGTDVIVQTGTDICADTVILNGTYTITGTICGHPIGINPIASEIPDSYNLYQNYPNPFNPVTRIKFDIPSDSRLRLKGPLWSGNDNVVLKIYDVLGREIAVLVNEQLKPGTYEAEWDASNYPSGVYFCRMFSGVFDDVIQMVVVK